MRYFTQNSFINLAIGIVLIYQDYQYKNAADVSVREQTKKDESSENNICIYITYYVFNKTEI